jgi:chemotaxis protein CheD
VSATPDGDGNGAVVSVAMARLAVASSPTKLRTMLGSCVGVILHDRGARVGGIAHVVLPDSRGATDFPGKYADTAIPALLAQLKKLHPPARPLAKLIGGASMFGSSTRTGPQPSSLAIGQSNGDAAEAILARLGIVVIARDLGGEAGRRVTLDLATGIVSVCVPGGDPYDV